MWKDRVVAYFKAPHRNFSEATEENHEYPQSMRRVSPPGIRIGRHQGGNSEIFSSEATFPVF
jgi:hypothetical protein